MSVWKTLLRLFVFYALSCFYGFVVLLKVAWRLAFKGTAILEVKPRPHPPNCLTDPDLGRHNYIKLKEVKLHYVEAGDHGKPLLLCLHGFPDFWYSWRHQLREFNKDFWVVAVDLRGYGDSDKPSATSAYTISKLVGDVEDLIPTLGRQSCIVMGHDWGAILAWHLASKRPQLVDRLIILNGPHPAVFATHVQSCIWQFFKSWYMFFFQIPFFPEFVYRLNDMEIINMLFASHQQGKTTFCEHDIEAYKYTFSTRGALTGPLNYYRASARSALLTRQDQTLEHKKVTMPVLIVWGTDDIALCKELAQLSSAMCEQCTLRMVKGSGHWVQLDSPQLVNEYVHEFLNVLKEPNERRRPPTRSLVSRVRSRLVSSVTSSAVKMSKIILSRHS